MGTIIGISMLAAVFYITWLSVKIGVKAICWAAGGVIVLAGVCVAGSVAIALAAAVALLLAGALALMG